MQKTLANYQSPIGLVVAVVAVELEQEAEEQAPVVAELEPVAVVVEPELGLEREWGLEREERLKRDKRQCCRQRAFGYAAANWSCTNNTRHRLRDSCT